MPTEKKDEHDSTHFLVTNPLGPFPAGATISREELHGALGADPKADKEDVAGYRAAGVKRLLKAGAISPTEDPEEAAKAKAKAEAEKQAEAKPDADKPAHPAPTQQPKK